MGIIETKPELFIIESLKLNDERNNRKEGDILSRMLSLSGKVKTKYYYLRTEREFDEIIDIFAESNYRYLHISCHASSKHMATTFDDIGYDSLGNKLNDMLDGRRVFVSACEMANKYLAECLLKDTGCYSLVGPRGKINFDDSAIFWSAFYHMMFKYDSARMKHSSIEFYVNKISDLLEEPINYFRRNQENARGYELVSRRN